MWHAHIFVVSGIMYNLFFFVLLVLLFCCSPHSVCRLSRQKAEDIHRVDMIYIFPTHKQCFINFMEKKLFSFLFFPSYLFFVFFSVRVDEWCKCNWRQTLKTWANDEQKLKRKCRKCHRKIFETSHWEQKMMITVRVECEHKYIIHTYKTWA